MPEGQGYIVLTVRFAKEGDQWTAECLELGTATCADTFEEIQEAIRAMISLHLNGLEDVGTRKAFFRKHNIRIRRNPPSPRPRRPVSVRLDEYVTRLTEPVPLHVPLAATI